MQSVSANVLAGGNYRHFMVLPFSPKSAGRELQRLGLLGSFLDPRRQHALPSPNVYLFLLETKLLFPISSASCRLSFGLPFLLVSVPSSFCVLHQFPLCRLFIGLNDCPVSTFHNSLPTDPGNLAPGCSFSLALPFCKNSSKFPCLTQSFLFPSCSPHAFYRALSFFFFPLHLPISPVPSILSLLRLLLLVPVSFLTSFTPYSHVPG